MGTSQLVCPDCEAPVAQGEVQISGFDRPVQCPSCGEVFMPWMLRVKRGLHAFLGGPYEEESLSFPHPYVFVPVTEAASLNARINGLTNGGTIWLEGGNYAAAGDLTFPNDNVTVMGVGQDTTILAGSVTMPRNKCRLRDLWVKATGKSYGIKLFNATAGPNRNEFEHVRVGGSVSSADGPTGPGLWLDGAILNVFDHCLFAFNGSDGIYVDTTDPSAGGFSTNVNTFRDCTSNLNGGYGVHTALGTAGVGGEPTPAIAGMLGHLFLGGNMEDNALGAAYVQSSFYTRFDAVDFESSINLGASGSLIEGHNCTYLIVENCHLSSTGDTGRAIQLFSSLSGRVVNNRIAGQFPNMDIVVFDENCVRCTAHGNAWWDPSTASGGGDVISPRWVSNRGQNWGYSA